MLEEDLRIFGLECGIFVFRFDRLQVTAQFLVLDAFRWDGLSSSVGLLRFGESFLRLAVVGARDGRGSAWHNCVR